MLYINKINYALGYHKVFKVHTVCFVGFGCVLNFKCTMSFIVFTRYMQHLFRVVIVILSLIPVYPSPLSFKVSSMSLLLSFLAKTRQYVS